MTFWANHLKRTSLNKTRNISHQGLNSWKLQNFSDMVLKLVPFFLFCCVILVFPVCADALAGTTATSPIRITILSGFLGSGKTTLLQHLLENKEGLKIAVIVNDVAAVNIDNKLLMGNQNNKDNDSTTGVPDSMIQLSNGCVCCSLSDELLSSISEILTLSDLRAEGDMFDHIVIELSGVSEPTSVRAKFQDAEYYNMPLMERVCLDTMVTVVDCSTFLRHLRNGEAVSREASPGLFFRNEEERLRDEQEMKELEEIDKIIQVIRTGDMENQKADSIHSGVSELLVEQTETSDVIVLNKIDTVDDDTINLIEQIVQRLNPKANIFRAQFGKVELDRILAVAKGEGAAVSGIVDDHKDSIQAAEQDSRRDHDHQTDTSGLDDSTSHDHSHNHHSHGINEHLDREDLEISKPHNHSHGHEPERHKTSTDPDCGDTSHNHSHNHSHGLETGDDNICNDPTCTDTSHSHSHAHGHSHSHEHNSSSPETYGGIGSYVYRARKPFHPGRLATFLRHLPVTRGKPLIDPPDQIEKEALKQALANVLRSKGFIWLADSHNAAMYWSHAGSSFEMKCVGSWWATLPQSQWPEDARDLILSDFDKKDYDLNLKFDSDTSGTGDRRQEIVFIGTNVPGEKICDALDRCLLTREEIEKYQYCVNEKQEQSLTTIFENPIQSKIETI